MKKQMQLFLFLKHSLPLLGARLISVSRCASFLWRKIHLKYTIALIHNIISSLSRNHDLSFFSGDQSRHAELTTSKQHFIQNETV